VSEFEPSLGSGVDWEDEDLPLEPVRSLFVTLGKAFRAYQLYDENNPVRHRFVESLKNEFQQLWTELDRLVVTVDEDHIYLHGQEVYSSDSRADSLAFLFFKDGVRELSFFPGMEQVELEAFLGVLQKARKLVPEGDDLLTVLWEADLRYFQYQYVDMLAEGVSLPEAGAGNTEVEMQAVLEAEDEEADAEAAAEGEAAAEAAPSTVSQDDFNPTLYALDAREMEQLRNELQKERERDTRGDVLAALFDRLEESQNRERQSEILHILQTLLPNFLSQGGLPAAMLVIQELRRLETSEGTFDEQRVAESTKIIDDVSAPETIHELIRALYDGTIRATPTQLKAFLQQLRGGALSPLLHASESVDHKELRAVLREAVQGIAGQHRGVVVQLLGESDSVVATGAARLAGDMQIMEAGPELAKLLDHAEPEVRLAAIEAAVSLKASTVAGALEGSLNDSESEVRIAAARALSTLQYGPAAAALGDIVKGKRIRQADISEKVAMFEAFGMTAGEDGIALLSGLLNDRGFLGKREPTEMRAAAALGLGRIAAPSARAELEKAAQDEDPVVRSNVNRAMRDEAQGP
jgi:hypothetical protein